MNYESSIPPAESLAGLKAQFRLLQYANAVLYAADNIPEVKDVQTMLENIMQQAEFYLDELKALCPTPDTKDGKETLKSSSLTNSPLNGTLVKLNPTDYLSA